MKKTKKSLLFSGLALMMSALLLAGTTFAWFTDSVTNKGNTIQAGELKIQFNYRDLDDSNDAWKAVPDQADDAGALFTNRLWEPGYSYGYDFTVKNVGSLAAKWELSFENIQCTGNVSNPDAELADVIEVYVIGIDEGKEALTSDNYKGTLAELRDNKNGIVRNGNFKPGDGPYKFSIVLKMSEDADNTYQGASLSFSLFLKAKQMSKEVDGFGNPNYDANAAYLEEQPVIARAGETKVIDLNNTNYSATGYDGVFYASNGGQITINGNGTVMANDVDNYAMAVWANGEGSKVVINGGTYMNNRAEGNNDDQMDMIYASAGGDIEINGGVFKCVTPKWTLNIQDQAYQNGTSTIVVKGGTFFEYDPSHASNENPEANFVADGYKVITEEKADGTWYTVVPETR